MSTQPVKEQPPAGGAPAPAKADPWAKEIEFVPFMGDTPIKLSVNLVLRYLCKPTAQGKVCTPEQALKFIMLCAARKLNPWEGDAFLVGFDGKDGPEFNLITAHQAFLKRAEEHPKYAGMESGIIVVRGEEVVELPGDFHNGDDVLVGGWAKVYRRDRDIPTYRRLKLAVFNTGRSRWNKDPAGMIVKCAEADALRSSFPNTLGGMFSEGELDDRPVVQTPQQRVAGIKAPPPAIENGTHAPAELVVRPEPAEEPAPVAVHARTIEEAETEAELTAAYDAAFADKRLTKAQKAQLVNLRDARLAALKNEFPADEPTADIGDWSDDDAEARAKEQQEKLAATR